MASSTRALAALGLPTAITSLLACSSILGVEDLDPEPPRLSALSVNVGTLVPAFSPEVTSYTVELPLTADSVEISATGGVGVIELKLDSTTFQASAVVAVVLEPSTVSIESSRSDGLAEEVTLEMIRGASWNEHSIVKDDPIAGPIEGGKFGSKLDGDGPFFIGARGTAAGFEGTALYELSADVWTFRTKSPPPTCVDTPGAGEYGASVAIRGDLLFIGAPSCATTTGSEGGLVQHFARREDGSFWFSEGVILDIIRPTLLNRYGTSIATSDGYLGISRIEAETSKVVEFLEPNADSWIATSGYNASTLGTIGDPVILESNGDLYIAARGRDFVIRGPETGLIHQATVSAPVTSVSFDGETLAVGAESDSNDAGVVFILKRATDSTVYQLEATLRASNAEAGDFFGKSVSLVGDFLIVGAPGESSDSLGTNGDQTNNAAAGSGAVYVFVRNGESWFQTAYVKASNVGAGDSFGTDVDILDNSFLVGAPGEDSTIDPTSDDLTDAGAVYFFELGR